MKHPHLRRAGGDSVSVWPWNEGQTSLGYLGPRHQARCLGLFTFPCGAQYLKRVVLHSVGSLQPGTASPSPIVDNVKKCFLTERPANAWLHLLRAVAITNVCYEFVVCHLLPQDGGCLMCLYDKMGHGSGKVRFRPYPRETHASDNNEKGVKPGYMTSDAALGSMPSRSASAPCTLCVCIVVLSNGLTSCNGHLPPKVSALPYRNMSRELELPCFGFSLQRVQVIQVS